MIMYMNIIIVLINRFSEKRMRAGDQKLKISLVWPNNMGYLAIYTVL